MIALLVWAVATTIIAGVATSLLAAAVATLRRERVGHDAMAARVNRYWYDEIARLHHAHAAMLDQMANVVNYGTTTMREGVVVAAEPDAELVVRQQVREDTIAVGVAKLSIEYEKMGLAIPEADVREEVISMLGGLTPRPHESVTLRAVP